MKRYKNLDCVMTVANGVANGTIKANHYRVLGAQRFLADLKRDDLSFEPKDAEFVINIIEKTYCHMQGEAINGTPMAGKPFLLQPFHKFIIYNLLALKIKKTGLNKYNECLIFIPRKNVKTSFASALAYALGLLYRRSGTKIYVVAAAGQQTLETFNLLKYNILRMHEEEIFKITDNHAEHSIEATFDDGFFELHALASNPDAQDSFNCNIAIADEMHAFKKAKQYTLFKKAMSAYSNKLMIGISTAGDDPDSFLAGKVDYGKRVLDGEIADDRYFFFIAEADMSVGSDGSSYLDYTNPEVQQMANPSYGVTIRPDDILADSLQAQNDPNLRKDFLAKSLNVFTTSVDTYFDMDKVRSSDEKYNWTLEELVKLPIKWYGGADLSKMFDLTGVVLHGRYKDVDITISHAFIPASQAAIKADEDNIPFFWWEEQGWLTLCNSDAINYDDVAKWFIQMRKMGFKIQLVGYDQRYSMEFVNVMKKSGFAIRNQTQRYTEKTEGFREIEKKINLQQFYYFHNKAYEYCIGNVHAIEDSDEFVRFEKIKQNRRIDLFDADVIAVKQLLLSATKSENVKAFFQEAK